MALVLVFLAPYGIGFMSQARGAAPAVAPALVNGASGYVTWNGINANTAPNPSSAIAWSFSTVATVQFVFTGPLTGVGVSQAFLVILFLGFPAYTKQTVESTPFLATGGTISMTYDLTQFKWYLQGVYELHAYLENPAGNSLFSENFYVRVTQPYDLVVATVGLLLLAIAELYLIATVGPRAGDKVRKAPPTRTPKDDSAETSADTGTPPPENS
ncbi:MAG: hypothetical protein WA688_03290 [Thermoplasmata archaeon]